ncbi:hypothetical protein [Phycisphaera mikurensis]|uniref:Uncharacterized protein n=1 Tax=Phycisphaera mikurensis (strain NBRC 102666 / KCTC 22515 / FYK2301M01) TaxID=1142394 RepID=I0IAA2_PHYMF|nr:hypothetical protein [Phycisphaera mikurensis]MBB6441810.1 hypothetical protein [Phycisphaera mikurensis]BAM02190.1 hypothetical protein PSMK_00310 [Phycisphaera mikurensis NBRC 102666]
MPHALRHRFLHAATVLIAAGVSPGASAAPAAGTTDAFTEHRLLRDLGQRGLPALLERWAADAPPLDDPATARVLAAAGAHAAEVSADAAGRAAAAAGDADALRAAATRAAAASNARLAALRELATDPALAGHPQRALFAADLAEALLVGRLERRLRHADLSVAYGRPSPSEAAPVAPALAEALAAAQEAGAAAARLRNALGRDRAAEADARASGLADAVLRGVAERRAPLGVATAALGLATLPAGDPYHDAAPPVPLAGRLDDPAAERRRLLDLARRSARALLDGDPGPLAPAASLLLARANAASGDLAGAAATLRNLVPELPPGRLAVTARLALAATQDGAAAEAALAAAAAAATRSSDPMLALLVADAAARHAAAAGDAAAAAGAYDGLPPALDALARSRQASLAAGAGVEAAGLPPRVAAAVAREALAAGDHARAAAAASAAVSGLGDPAALPEGVERDAALGAAADLAAATAAASPDDPAAVDASIASLLAIARDFPRSAEAEPAIARAADLAASAQASASRPDGPVADRYAEVMSLLFSRFAETPAAERHRLYWAYAGHTLRGDDAGAAAVYELVPADHPQRLDALGLSLDARERAAAAAPSREAARTLLDAAEATAERLAAEARARGRADPAAAVLGVGRAALAAARIQSARGNPSAAAAGLDGLDARLASVSGDPAATAAVPGLLAEAAGLRVAAFLAAGEPAAAAAEAAGMMEAHPAAAAGVVKSVLADLLARADALAERARDASASRAAELEDEAAGVSASAVQLAALLLADANRRGLSEADMLPWRLAYANGLTRSGDPGGAIAFLAESGVEAAFPADAGVLEAAAEARFALGVRRTRDAGGTAFTLTDEPGADAAARGAAPYYDRLIRGLAGTRPPAFWNAWARRLSINLALGEGVDRVGLSVAQLEDQDPALGGPASAARLRAIRAAALR